MYIKNIYLKNFRNYEELDIKLHPKLNIFVGKNAQGKTNIIESIYLSSFGKSFRTNQTKELIKLDKSYSHILIKAENDYNDIEIELRMNGQSKKEVKVNYSYLNKLSDIIGHINTVIFTPEDLDLIKRGPTNRRNFINRSISQISKNYCYDLIQYKKILNQRNQLIKKMYRSPNKNLKTTLEVWDEKLIDHGINIMKKRIDFINEIDSISQKIHSDITNSKEFLKVEYDSNIKVQNEMSYDKIKNVYSKKLNEKLDTDLKRGYTSVGPHRDDIFISINNLDTKKFGSQGQQRTAALSLKLSEIRIIKKVIGEYPVLLLDDVMSELDINRREYLIKNLNKIQTIITTTDIDDFLKVSDSKIFKVNKGKIENS